MAKPRTPRRPHRSSEHDAQGQEIHAEVAQMIQTARREARLTQSELAKRIGSHQQAIARFENPNYDGHSVRVLNRIAHAMGLRLSISYLLPNELE